MAHVLERGKVWIRRWLGAVNVYDAHAGLLLSCNSRLFAGLIIDYDKMHVAIHHKFMVRWRFG